MTKREENLRVKQIVKRITGLDNVRIRSGRGTSSSWWYVILEESPTKVQKEEIIRSLDAEGLLDYFWSDGNKMANLNWQTKFGRML
jgi:hypothetical protein